MNIKKLISSKPFFGMIFPYLNITPPFPLYLLLHITLNCNRQCKHCYQQDDFYKNISQKEMDINVIEQILKNCSKSFFKPYVHLFGGEPLFYKEIDKLSKLIKKYKYKISLTTNGDKIVKNLDFLAMRFVKQINISLNPQAGKNKEEAFNTLLKSLKKLKQANPKIKINLNYNLNPADYLYALDTLIFFSNHTDKGLVDVFVMQHYMDKKDLSEAGFERSKLSKLLKDIEKCHTIFPVRFLPNIKDIDKYYFAKDFLGHRCYTPFLGLSIMPDGKVTPGGGVFACNSVLGNLSKDSIKSIWQGKVFKNFKNAVRKKLPKICIRCCQKIY